MKTKVMVNGLTGNMATLCAERVIRANDLELFTYSLTGPDITEKQCVVDHVPIELIRPEDREAKILELLATHEPFIAVDFVGDKKNPNLAKEQVDFYCRHGIPFVMGTTGGKRDSPEPGADNSDTLQQRVRDSDVVAVIAPNMAKQIVALQGFMEGYARNNPGAMGGYVLSVVESHQQGKADTSGTAKAMVKYFNTLGIDFGVEGIIKIREPEEQRKLGVPEEYLDAHGWHTYEILSPESNKALIKFKKALWRFLSESKVFQEYTLAQNSTHLTRTSLDETVTFHARLEDNGLLGLSHNVNGRSVYVSGAIDRGVRFLQGKIEAGEKGKAYSMINVN